MKGGQLGRLDVQTGATQLLVCISFWPITLTSHPEENPIDISLLMKYGTSQSTSSQYNYRNNQTQVDRHQHHPNRKYIYNVTSNRDKECVSYLEKNEAVRIHQQHKPQSKKYTTKKEALEWRKKIKY